MISRNKPMLALKVFGFLPFISFVAGCAANQTLSSSQADPCPVNWFAISAAFAKPQLGGFAASMETVNEALSKQQETCQRSNSAPNNAQYQLLNGSRRLTLQYGRRESTALKCVYTGGFELALPPTDSCPVSINH